MTYELTEDEKAKIREIDERLADQPHDMPPGRSPGSDHLVIDQDALKEND